MGASHRLQRLALAVCAVLTASTPVASAIAPIAVAGTACVDGWQAMPVEAALATGAPTGSASLHGAPAWFVGRANARATAARWDGTTWRKVATPWTTDTGLTGVSAVSANAAWTAGFSRLYSPRPIAARWNGSSWHAVAVPPQGGQTNFTDVVALAPKKALAVGPRLVAGRTGPLAIFRNKRTWFTRSPVLEAGAEGSLTAVTQAPDTRLWAVGWQTIGGVPAPWIGYWDGVAWIVTPSADVGRGLAYLTDITFDSAGAGWAVGYLERDTGGYEAVVERWDGLAWQVETTPWLPEDSAVLTTVAVDSIGSVVVAGQHMSDAGPSAFIAVNEAGVWRETTPRNDPYPGSWAQGASALSEGGFVVGYFGTGTQAFISCVVSPGGPSVGPGQPASPPAGAGFIEDIHIEGDTGSGGNLITAVDLPGYFAADVTAAAGLTMSTMTYSGLVADFDADTWPDIFINRHGADVPLLELGGETGFTVADADFQFTDRHLCAAADANGDGPLDLFCTVGRRQGTALGADEFLVDVGDTGGTQSAAQFGVLDITGRGRAAAFVHFATDALPSLFIANEPVRIDGLPSFNRFYRNVDGTHFVPAPEFGLDNSSGGLCALAVNLDADADDELLLCTIEPGGGLATGARIYDFDGARFMDRTTEWGITPSSDRDLEVADFNGDGLLDVAQLKDTRLRISLASPTGGYINTYNLTTKKAVAMAVGDVNNDARPDIYVSRQALSNGAHLMLVNDGDGTSFTNVVIPQVGHGTADDVLALDYDKNGLTDFLTFNGISSPGPLKLTAFFEEPG